MTHTDQEQEAFELKPLTYEGKEDGDNLLKEKATVNLDETGESGCRVVRNTNWKMFYAMLFGILTTSISAIVLVSHNRRNNLHQTKIKNQDNINYNNQRPYHKVDPPEEIGHFDVYIRESTRANSRRPFQPLRIPAIRYNRDRLPLIGPFLNFEFTLPIFVHPATRQTVMYSPKAGFYVIPPIFNVYGQAFSIGELMVSGYASFLSTGFGMGNYVNIVSLFRSEPFGRLGKLKLNSRLGGFEDGIHTRYRSSFPSKLSRSSIYNNNWDMESKDEYNNRLPSYSRNPYYSYQRQRQPPHRVTCAFSPPKAYWINTGAFPRSVVVADVNGDGKPDIIVTNTLLDNATVFFNTGSGKFAIQPTVPSSGGGSPYSVTVGDVNGDGKIDIIIANYEADNIGILINNGDGKFFTQVIYSMTIGSSPRFVTTADVNNDGKLDVVVVNSGGDNLCVFSNKGDGTFFAQATYSMETGSSPRSVAVGDVNGDGKLDMVVANSDVDNICILFNLGNGTFFTQATYSMNIGSLPNSVVMNDVNGDDKLDVIVANTGGDSVSVFFNAGNGTFFNQTTYSTGTGSSPVSVVVGDVNGDDKYDIIVAESGVDSIGVLRNKGNGFFSAQTKYSVGNGSYPIYVAAADVNGDKKIDIIVANYGSDNVNVFLAC